MVVSGVKARYGGGDLRGYPTQDGSMARRGFRPCEASSLGFGFRKQRIQPLAHGQAHRSHPRCRSSRARALCHWQSNASMEAAPRHSARLPRLPAFASVTPPSNAAEVRLALFSPHGFVVQFPWFSRRSVADPTRSQCGFPKGPSSARCGRGTGRLRLHQGVYERVFFRRIRPSIPRDIFPFVPICENRI